MPRKIDLSSEEREPIKKRSCNDKQEVVLIDLDGKKWKLGKALGLGGFGEIYEARNINSKEKNESVQYVAKIEKHSNGPLFVEVNCYLRIAKQQMIDDWRQTKNLPFLGMPHYVASGSLFHNGEKHRFLIIPRYKKDLEKVLKEKKILNLKTVLAISLQILDVLEYIHDKGYVHSDVKASNIMVGQVSSACNNCTKLKKNSSSFYGKNSMYTPIGLRKRPQRQPRIKTQVKRLRSFSKHSLRPVSITKYVDDIPYLEEVLHMHETKPFTTSKVSFENNSDVSASNHAYLLDYGLVSKYLLANGSHKPFCTDERKAHAGTVMFCSRDAHKGVASRRSDLESLGYNIIYWLTGELPWMEDLTEPEEIATKKNRCFRQLESFLQFCFYNEYPNFLLEYFKYLSKLTFEEKPNYELCRRIFKAGLRTYGYNDDSVMDFDETNDWRQMIPKKSKKQRSVMVNTCSFLIKSPLKPLSSNIVFKRPKLRKQVKSIKIPDSIMNWSKILTDPENILKQARERKSTDESEDFTEIDIDALNPTYAMINVYNKALGRSDNSKYRYESYSYPNNIDGYTPAMMQIHLKMKKPKQIHYTVKFYSTIRNCGRSTRKWEDNCNTPPVLRSSRMLTQY